MSLVKTEKGRSALINRDRGLSHRERQILVMSDGKRTRQQMRELFVADISDDFKRLFALSLLMDVGDKAIKPENMNAIGTFRMSALGDFPVRTEHVSTTGFGSLSGSGALLATFPAALPIASTAASAVAPTSPKVRSPESVAPRQPNARRSMAAAKMYMIDILQRMRDMESPAFSVAIQTSENEADLAANLINAARYICRKSEGNFGLRVFEKLYETISLAYVPEMDFLANELQIQQVNQ